MRRYAIITPCRDEAEFLQRTVDSVAAQTVRPARWIIVDDGSTDDTPRLLEEACRAHDFIEVLRRDDRGDRAVGPGVIDAFYAGLDQLDLDELDYVCKLDADLVFGPRYFERLMELCEADPWLGTVSGKLFLERDGRLVPERCGDENSVGPSKFYRVACFRDIGGFVREVCWDGIDGHVCRMSGWVASSVDEPDLRIVHLRQMGSSHKGLWTGCLRWGRGKHFMGSGLAYMLAVAVYRSAERPWLAGGLGILCGYLGAVIRRRPRYERPDYRRALRRYEWSCLLRGKGRTTREAHDRIRAECPPHPIAAEPSPASVSPEPRTPMESPRECPAS
jgi:glycosyltransferase involved in cell wall biosynthesis